MEGWLCKTRGLTWRLKCGSSRSEMDNINKITLEVRKSAVVGFISIVNPSPSSCLHPHIHYKCQDNETFPVLLDGLITGKTCYLVIFNNYFNFVLWLTQGVYRQNYLFALSSKNWNQIVNAFTPFSFCILIYLWKGEWLLIFILN